MQTPLLGIHHLTAIASDPQRNVDFYAGVLGLRLVKKTVNFDDPSAYHLYYGDENGTPGSIITFFYWPGTANAGRVGAGQSTRISFSAPPASLGFWERRLTDRRVTVQRVQRFGEDTLAFADPDGIPLEIVAEPADARPGWGGGDVPAGHALRGMHTAELTVRHAEPTENLLTQDMGYRLVRRAANRARFETGAGGSGTFIDVIAAPAVPVGTGGVGTIHHIAWRVADDPGQIAMRERLTQAGWLVSPVRDRSYFHSIYYRERGGILFEIATDTPGFAVDEATGTLGTELKLPPQFEPARSQIEALLPPLRAAASVAASH